MFVVLDGTVAITQRDGLGHVVPIVRQGPGSSPPKSAHCPAGRRWSMGMPTRTCETLLVLAASTARADHRRGRPRRAPGARADPAARRADRSGRQRAGADRRSRIAPTCCDCRTSCAATAIRTTSSTRATTPARPRCWSKSGAAAGDPLVVCPDGSVLLEPDGRGARALHRHGRHRSSDDELFDVRSSWAPARPAWRRRSTPPRKVCAWWCWTAAPTAARLAPARASRTTSAFPTGISGQALAGRAYVQAQKFGAEMLIPAQAVALDCSRAERRRRAGRRAYRRAPPGGHDRRGRQRRALPPAAPCRGSRSSRAAACGTGPRRSKRRCARTRRWRWSAAAIRQARRRCSSQRMREGPHAGARARPGAHSMSRYLIDRIEATPNIELLPHTELTGCMASAERPRSACAGATGRDGSETQTLAAQRLPVRWRRARDRLARRLRRCGRLRRLRAHRRLRRRPATGHAAGRSSRVSRACSRSATCARVRSSAWAARSAKARRWWRRFMRCSPAVLARSRHHDDRRRH